MDVYEMREVKVASWSALRSWPGESLAATLR